MFEALRHAARDDDRELVQLRLAECDYFLKRAAQRARRRQAVSSTRASRQGEALFFYAVATRELGGRDEYLRIVRRIVDEFPTQSWAEEALNNLATHYILQNDDEQRGRDVPRDVREVPDRALRRARGVEDRLVGVPERRATPRPSASSSARRRDFPRSDYRPPWLYWSGAGARGAARSRRSPRRATRWSPPTI